jgi:hypothetical protein
MALLFGLVKVRKLAFDNPGIVCKKIVKAQPFRTAPLFL